MNIFFFLFRLFCDYTLIVITRYALQTSEYKILYLQSCTNYTSKHLINSLSFAHWIISAAGIRNRRGKSNANKCRSSCFSGWPNVRSDNVWYSRLFPNQEECLPRTCRWLFDSGVENKSASFRERCNEMPPSSENRVIWKSIYIDSESAGGSATTENGDEDQLTGFLLHDPIDFHRNYPLESPFASLLPANVCSIWSPNKSFAGANWKINTALFSCRLAK